MGAGRNPPPPSLEQRKLVGTSPALPSLDLRDASLVPPKVRSDVVLKLASSEPLLNLAEDFGCVRCAFGALWSLVFHGLSFRADDRVDESVSLWNYQFRRGDYPAPAPGQG